MTEPTPSNHGIWRISAQSAGVLGLFALVLTGLLGATYSATKPVIDDAIAQEKLRLINKIIDNDDHKTVVLRTVTHTVDAAPISPEIIAVHLGKVLHALVFESTAPDGYNGDIRFIIAMTLDANLINIRVVNHRETPGLGDYIDLARDRNRDKPWISQFHQIAQPQNKVWRVVKDGGDFDARTGATVSARAVVNRLGLVIEHIHAHWRQLLALSQRQPS